MDINDHISVAVRTSRDARGWTQAELCRRSGVDSTRLSEWERGVRPWHLRHLVPVAAAFGVEVRALLPGCSAALDVDSIELSILRAFRDGGWVGLAKMAVDEIARDS